MKENWFVLPKNEMLSNSLANALSIHPVIAQLLVNRGITTVDEARTFIDPKLKNLNDPFLFNDMEKCVSRVLEAHKRKEKVAFYGDYDVDGITSSALLSLLFTEIGIENECYIPHRISEGYGLSKEGIDYCSESGAKLIITVDCGIHAFEEIKYAKELGLNVIVTDHHEPSEDVPECLGIINPKIKNSGYPFRDLAGVGVAFKLAHGLIKKAREYDCEWAFNIDLKKYLDFVALGTIADIVPLKGENRVLAKNGFIQICKSNRPGIKSLKNKTGIGDTITSFDIAFRIAPRINATGRIGDAKDSLLILKTDDYSKADFLANNLDSNNKERQKIEEKVYKEALAEVDEKINLEEDKVIVIEKDNWPVGVVGIVSSKITKLFYRPSFVISMDEDGCKGSGRSIDGFDLSRALEDCADILDGFGGHKCAAGITLKKENVDEFRLRINQIASKELKQEDLVKKNTVDAMLSLADINEEIVSQLELLQPFGQDNPSPVFISKKMVCDSNPIILKEKHVKFYIKGPKGSIEAIYFNIGERINDIEKGMMINLVYQLSFNHFNGRTSIQLNIKDFEKV
ncbi:single-stranded-DNA-specific exonuclease RecJ [Chlamydiota bacterium]